VQATEVQFLLILFFKHHVYNGFGGNYFNLIFLGFALFFFSSFILPHSRMGGAQLASQRKGLKVHQDFATVKVYTLME
jgi:hypothetical protein